MANTAASKTISHGKWTFDYRPNKFTYKMTPDSISENKFKLYDVNNSLDDLIVANYRKAAVVHKLIRNELRTKIHDSVLFTDITEYADELLKKYSAPICNQTSGYAFPLGISVNEVICHDTANIGDTRTLKTNDVVKLDLGFHLNGCIIDSAFTMIVGEDQVTKNFYAPLLDASADATYTGIAMSGADARLYEISEMISEVISSYELEDGTKIVPVFGLGGHNILPYKVHGEKLILSVPHKTQKGLKMDEGEVYAIETYASTGHGKPNQTGITKCNHFMIDNKISSNYEKLKGKEKNNKLLKWAMNDNKTLPFTQQWCSHIDLFEDSINYYVEKRGIVGFPPMVDTLGSKTSQFEHTIHIKANGGVEIFSLGNDY